MAYKHITDCQVNFNTADVDELTAVLDISEEVARNIVDYRNEHGPFSSLDDVRQVPGFTDESLKSIYEDCDVMFDY